MRVSPRRRFMLVLLSLVLIVTLGYVTPKADALTVSPMTRTGTYDVHGDFILVGNGTVTPTGYDWYYYNYMRQYADDGRYLVTDANDPEYVNDYYNMKFTDTDSNFSTFNSSSASYTIPKAPPSWPPR